MEATVLVDLPVPCKSGIGHLNIEYVFDLIEPFRVDEGKWISGPYASARGYFLPVVYTTVRITGRTSTHGPNRNATSYLMRADGHVIHKTGRQGAAYSHTFQRWDRGEPIPLEVSLLLGWVRGQAEKPSAFPAPEPRVG